MAILNAMDIFRRCCKVNFGSIKGQVKSRHFSKKIGTRRQYYHFLHKFLEIMS